MDKIGVAAVGDANLVATFSGIPFYFLKALQNAGIDAYGWEMDLKKIANHRKLWNLLQMIQLQKRGGYQYSTDFSRRLLEQLPEDYFKDTIISFNQHYPPSDYIANKGGKVYHYIDATFTQLIDRYEIGKIIGNKIKAETLIREKSYFEAATHIVTFQNWARDSVINDYGIDKKKVSVILPGANYFLPTNFQFGNTSKQGVGKQTALVLGFIGKDWKRKGLDVLIDAAQILLKKKYLVEIHCAGNAPLELTKYPFVKFSGFIDKAKEPERFISFLQNCDLGCLFSKAEFSSISVFEFLSAGIPVAGYVVDGMGDLYFPETSIRFEPTNTATDIADAFISFIENNNYRETLQRNAKMKSQYVTWERSVNEWKKILNQ